nr:zinc finger, CCHC-type [Tanacetum cinerariifolium]
MASMNTMLNIEKLDGNIIQKHEGSKQVGFKQLGPGVETGVHIVHDEKHVWFEVELQGAQRDRELKVFQYTYLVNRSPSPAIGLKKPVDMLGSFGWLANIKQGILEPVKVKCIFLGYHKSIVGNKLRTLIDVTSNLVLYRNMGSMRVENTRNFHWFWCMYGFKCSSYDICVYYRSYAPGNSILSLDGSLSGDCDVKKNGKWSCIYAVGSQEYQMVCTRPDIASTDVGMLDGFDRGLQTYVQVFVDFDYAMGRSITRGGVCGPYGGYEGSYLAKGTLGRVRCGT